MEQLLLGGFQFLILVVAFFGHFLRAMLGNAAVLGDPRVFRLVDAAIEAPGHEAALLGEEMAVAVAAQFVLIEELRFWDIIRRTDLILQNTPLRLLLAARGIRLLLVQRYGHAAD